MLIKQRTLNQVSFHLVDHCNLNCRSCFHYSPLVREPKFKNLEQHKKEIIRLAELNNNKKMHILLLGGEPLLHPQINDFCRITRTFYPNATITISTNGTLIPLMGQEFFDTINENQIILRLSDYDLKLDLQKIIPNNVELYRVLDRKKMINASLNLAGTNAEKNFDICRRWVGSACVNIRDGRIYQCGYCAYFDYFEKYFNLKLEEADLYKNSIDMFNSSLEEIEEYLNKSIPFCKYCNVHERLTNPEVAKDWSISQRSIDEWAIN